MGVVTLKKRIDLREILTRFVIDQPAKTAFGNPLKTCLVIVNKFFLLYEPGFPFVSTSPQAQGYITVIPSNGVIVPANVLVIKSDLRNPQTDIVTLSLCVTRPTKYGAQRVFVIRKCWLAHVHFL